MDASPPVPSNIGTLDDPDDPGESPSQGQRMGVLPVAEAPLQSALKPPPEPKPKKPPKAAPNADRTPGKSLLPLTKVQKILRADKELPICAKEAAFLISVATEEFIKRLGWAGQQQAMRQNRSTVQGRDIATAVRRADEFVFLEEILADGVAAPPPALAKRKQKAMGSVADTLNIKDAFGKGKVKAPGDADEEGGVSASDDDRGDILDSAVEQPGSSLGLHTNAERQMECEEDVGDSMDIS